MIRRGDVFVADLSPVVGHEQGGTRPALIVSVDRFNQGASGLVTVMPLTRTRRGVPWHVLVSPPEGGLNAPSVIMVEQMRSLSIARLRRRLGAVDPATLAAVAIRLRRLLGL